MDLFKLRNYLVFLLLILSQGSLFAQYQQTTEPTASGYYPDASERMINPLPATEVFPENIPTLRYPSTNSTDDEYFLNNARKKGETQFTAGAIPPELNDYVLDIERKDDLILEPEEVFATRPKLSPSKKGILQSLTLDSTWLAGSGDDIGQTDVLASVTIGFPAPTIKSPLLLTAGYGMHFLVGPESIHAPSTLYDVYFTSRWLSQLNDRWGVMLSLTIGYYSDFQTDNGDAFRLSGMALWTYKWSPSLDLIVGVVYLNRDDFSLLPAVGLIWEPSDWQRIELTFPRPRYKQLWDYGTGYEDWWYISGEVGGGTWAVEHPIGSQDSLTISDYRILFGFERKRDGGGKSFLEIGYVFGRSLEYKKDPAELDMDGTILLRSGWWY